MGESVDRYRSIITRLTLMVTGILVTAVLVVGSLALLGQYRQLHQALATKATTLVQFMAQVTPLSILSLNFVEMNNNVTKVVLTDDEAVYAIVLNEQGIPLVHFFKDTDPSVTSEVRDLLKNRNPEFERVNRLTAQDVLGKTPAELSTELAPMAAVFTERLMEAMASATLAKIDLSWTKEGKPIWWYVRVVPEFDANGKVASALTIWTEITERKQAEMVRAQLAAIVQSSHDAIIGKDLEGVITSWNPGAEVVYGYRAEEVVGKPISTLAPEGRKNEIMDLLERIRRGEGVMDFETERFGKDGKRIDVALDLSPIRDATGSIVGASTIARDITEKKHAERRIRQLNRTYAVLSDINQLIVRVREPQSILDGACRIAVEKGGFLLAWVGLVDAATERLHFAACAGATPGTREVLDRLFSDPQQGGTLISQALETGGHAVCNDIASEASSAAWCAATLQGGYRSMASFPLTVAGRRVGAFNLYVGETDFFDADELRLLDELAADISFALEGCEREGERQRALVRLHDSEERFRELAETIEDVFWITDPDKSRMLYISPGYERIWGRSCRSLYEQPRNWLEAIHPEDRERVLRAATTRQAEGTYDEEYRIVRPDGQVRWISDRAFPVRDAAGRVERLTGVARDITDRRQLVEQLRLAQKMEAIGTLAGGIAHDFNNILAAILGNVDLAMMDLDPSHPIGEYLAEIKKAGDRATRLVKQILAFSRQQPQERRVISLAPIIEETTALLRATLPASVELVRSVPKDTPNIQADATQIQQVLMNLCTNAWQALEGKPGRIEIRLKSIARDAARTGALAGIRPGRHLCLSVSDTGKGMNEATIKRIFEPFFTTKAVGKGTGLGLSVVHGIVQNHEGVIKVISQPGQGTTFQLYFPTTLQTPEELPPRKAFEVPRGRGQRIVYLDDEEPLVLLATRMLQRLGYRVTGFTRTEDCLKAFRADPGQFDLVVTDLNMPGSSGLQVAKELLALRPNLPVVLCSGYITEDLKEDARRIGIRHVIYKPNTVEELGTTIHRLATESR